MAVASAGPATAAWAAQSKSASWYWDAGVTSRWPTNAVAGGGPGRRRAGGGMACPSLAPAPSEQGTQHGRLGRHVVRGAGAALDVWGDGGRRLGRCSLQVTAGRAVSGAAWAGNNRGTAVHGPATATHFRDTP